LELDEDIVQEQEPEDLVEQGLGNWMVWSTGLDAGIVVVTDLETTGLGVLTRFFGVASVDMAKAFFAPEEASQEVLLAVRMVRGPKDGEEAGHTGPDSLFGSRSASPRRFFMLFFSGVPLFLFFGHFSRHKTKTDTKTKTKIQKIQRAVMFLDFLGFDSWYGSIWP
jgi:hypothetical protein